MNDMSRTIVPKSDQLNADDLLAGPITITISGVEIRPGQEQPVSIFYAGDNGKPYKACKSMCRVMVSAWGADASKYVGRSMTLFCDPKVKWGGMEVGGIRISHMSDIDGTMTMALTMTRGNKKPFVVRPLKPNSAPQSQPPVASQPPAASGGTGGAEPADEALISARKQAQDAYDNASREVKRLFDAMNEGGKPIPQMTEKGATRACAWLKAEIDKEAASQTE